MPSMWKTAGGQWCLKRHKARFHQEVSFLIVSFQMRGWRQFDVGELRVGAVVLGFLQWTIPFCSIPIITKKFSKKEGDDEVFAKCSLRVHFIFFLF